VSPRLIGRILVAISRDKPDPMLGGGRRPTVVSPAAYASTNRSAKNKQYRGHAMLDWLNDRAATCQIEPRAES
jgi:hypothetical protein